MKRIIYISTAKLHRNRANLIQTLNTANGIYNIHKNFTLFMSPYKSHIPYKKRLCDFGVNPHLPIKFSTFLHSRWKIFKYVPFVILHKNKLKHSHVYTRSFRISNALIKFSIPHVFEAHEFDQLYEDNFMVNLRHGLNRGIVLKVVATNNSLKELLLKEGIQLNKIEILPNGVNIQSFSKVKKLTPQRFKHPTLIHIGTLTPQKGLYIVQKLAQKGLKIILAGNIAGNKNWSENVEVLGFIPHRDIPKIYNRAEISIIPYQEDLEYVNSFCPIKLVESMAARRAIIASDLKPMRELVTNEKEALLVPPSDINAWIKAIEKLSKDPEFALQLAQNAYEKAKELDWKKRAQKIIHIFNKTQRPLDRH